MFRKSLKTASFFISLYISLCISLCAFLTFQSIVPKRLRIPSNSYELLAHIKKFEGLNVWNFLNLVARGSYLGGILKKLPGGHRILGAGSWKLFYN